MAHNAYRGELMTEMVPLLPVRTLYLGRLPQYPNLDSSEVLIPPALPSGDRYIGVLPGGQDPRSHSSACLLTPRVPDTVPFEQARHDLFAQHFDGDSVHSR